MLSPISEISPASSIPKKGDISRELKLSCLDLIRIFSDPLTSPYDWELAEQLEAACKNHEALGSPESHEALCKHVELLDGYFDCKNAT